MATHLPTSTYPRAVALLSEGCCPMCDRPLERSGGAGRCGACGVEWRLAGGELLGDRDLSPFDLGRLLEREGY